MEVPGGRGKEAERPVRDGTPLARRQAGIVLQPTAFVGAQMEAITRLVADSLARHGFDLPVDPRRLKWSRWSRCDSPRSLLVVPSKPGIFALAEEILDLGSAH